MAYLRPQAGNIEFELYDLEINNAFVSDNIILYNSDWKEISKEEAYKILSLRDDRTRLTKLF